MKVSQAGIDLIKAHEGLRLRAYICAGGKPTIGYGHTRTVFLVDIYSKFTITEHTAESLLKQDVSFAEITVSKHLPQAKQHEFDSLCSFVFNVGIKRFIGSTLLRKIKAGASCCEIKTEFERWNKAGGKVQPGLVKRRTEEAQIYCHGYKETL
jgi:lysozyme